MTKSQPNETTYLWENIPRELWNDARAKAMRERKHMKDVLKELLEAWVAGAAVTLSE